MDIAVTTTTTTLSTTIPAAPSATKPAHDITLYWLDQSRAQRIVWLLEETKLPYTTVVFHRQADLTAPPETRTIHPLGKLPMLNVDGTVYAESALIAEMVVDRFARWLQPNRDGSKDSEAAWWNYRYWIGFCEGSMLVPLLTALLNRGGDGERIKALNDGYLKHLYELHMGFIEAELTARGPYICGEQFTAADIMISYPLLDLAPIIVPGYTAEAYPHIFAYTDRLRTRDAYKSSQEKMIGEERFDTLGK